MRTIILTIPVPEELQELLIAELADLDFDAFDGEGDILRAYGPAPRWDVVRREEVERWLIAHGLEPLIKEDFAPDVNWNEKWEASIQPLAVGPFLIKPSWADIAPEHADLIVLEVDPKMSFGTGYHASTRLALRFLRRTVTGSEFVLDAGCGTGILAIAALRLGAARAIGFDIDPWARINAAENAERNGIAERLEVREGSIEVVSEGPFDLILANINRNALLAMLPEFAASRAAGGRIVFAGLLLTDRDHFVDALHQQGLTLLEEAQEDEWWACVAGG